MEKTFILKTVKKVIGLEETSSTQTLAQSLADTETDGTLILACRQTAATGSKGEPFYAGEGGVYFTLILNPQAKITSQKLMLAMSNAISDVINSVSGIKTKLSKTGEILAYDKTARTWKKCADVITQEPTTGTWLLGAGIYLNNRLPIALRTTSISLKSILGSETSKELFLDEVLNNFWKEYAFI